MLLDPQNNTNCLNMNIVALFKKTFVYQKIYHPYQVARIRRINHRKQELFKRDGYDALKTFAKCMDDNGITYWLEFGTLLGVYRDGDFVPNEMDIDVGLFLSDAKKAFNSLLQYGFELVREFHVVGENGLEQTFRYGGTTIDLMFFYEENDQFWCNGASLPRHYKTGRVFKHMVTSHHFAKFTCSCMAFKDISVSIPKNTEEHLIEIFGTGYKVYDPDFKDDLNKTYYDIKEKSGFGFIRY